jgi:hypothetical protein
MTFKQKSGEEKCEQPSFPISSWPQLFLAPAKISADFHSELEEIDKILTPLPEFQGLLAAVCSELSQGTANDHGRQGLTAEQEVTHE